MRKILLLFVIAIGLSIFSSAAFAENDYFIFAGVSDDTSLPSTIRVGLNSWELGELTAYLYGLDKIFRDGSTYVAAGGGLASGDTVGFGLYGALGWEPKLFWGLKFRIELTAVAATNAYVRGDCYAGLSLHF